MSGAGGEVIWDETGVPCPAPTPLLPPSATASVKMEPENKYLPELMAEKDSLDPSFTHAMQLLTAGKRASGVPLGRPASRGHGW